MMNRKYYRFSVDRESRRNDIDLVSSSRYSTSRILNLMVKIDARLWSVDITAAMVLLCPVAYVVRGPPVLVRRLIFEPNLN